MEDRERRFITWHRQLQEEAKYTLSPPAAIFKGIDRSFRFA
jgi:hypothetical protein